MDNKSFVIYDSYYDTYRRLKKRDPNIALEFIDAILNYGFTGEIPEENAIVWDYGLPTIFSTIDASTSRYERAVKNSGGRPTTKVTLEEIYEQIEICDTWKEVAANLKIDADTLRSVRQKYGLTERSPRKYRNSETEKPKNALAQKTEKAEKLNCEKAEKTEKLLLLKTEKKPNETPQKTENRKTEKPNFEKPKKDDIEVFRSYIETTTKIEPQNRKTEKPKNQTEKPKNLNDNDNDNDNLNNKLRRLLEDKTEKKTAVETEKTEKIDNNVFRLSPQKTLVDILQQDQITSLEADRLLTESDLPLYREGNILYSELDEQTWKVTDS